VRGAVMYAAGDVRVEECPDPRILRPTDAIIRLPAICVCGSDLWPYRGFDAVDRPSACGTSPVVSGAMGNQTPVIWRVPAAPPDQDAAFEPWMAAELAAVLAPYVVEAVEDRTAHDRRCRFLGAARILTSLASPGTNPAIRGALCPSNEVDLLRASV
jgi:hypothetical protein